MEQLKIVLISIVLLASILKTDAIECYECIGRPDSDCAKAISESMDVNTCAGKSVCIYLDALNGTERMVARGCSMYGPESCTLFPLITQVFNCKICEDDKCNVHITE